MILLQGGIAAGAAMFVLPSVVLAHLCGILYFYGRVMPDYDRYSNEQKALVWFASIVLLGVAVVAIPLWSIFAGLASMFVFAASKTIGIIILVIVFFGLLFLVSKLIYNQNYKDSHPTFSAKYFGYSVLTSLGLLVAALCVILFILKDVQID